MRQSETGDRVTFSEDFVRVQSLYSRDIGIGARKRWEDVYLFNQGKVTTREWQEYEVNFKSAWHEVRGATEEEARRLLLAKVPSFILKWITEEEERRHLANPTVRIYVTVITDLVGVAVSVQQLIGRKPTKVSKVNE